MTDTNNDGLLDLISRSTVDGKPQVQLGSGSAVTPFAAEKKVLAQASWWAPKKQMHVLPVQNGNSARIGYRATPTQALLHFDLFGESLIDEDGFLQSGNWVEGARFVLAPSADDDVVTARMFAGGDSDADGVGQALARARTASPGADASVDANGDSSGVN